MRGCLLIQPCGCSLIDGKLTAPCAAHREAFEARQRATSPTNPTGTLKPANAELERWMDAHK